MSRLDLVRKNRRKIIEIARRNKATNVRVFGSVARGEDSEDSDIDFLVTFKPGYTLFDRAGLLIDLGKCLDCKVDVVSDKNIYPRIRDEILNTAIAI